MSQYVTVTTDIMKDVKDYLMEKAIDELGYDIDRNINIVRGERAQDNVDRTVDYVIYKKGLYEEDLENIRNMVGIKYEYDNNGSCQATLKGDLYYLNHGGIFLNDLLMKYQELNIEETHMSMRNSSLVSRREVNGTIELCYSIGA